MLRRSPSVITISETDVAEIKRLAEARTAANRDSDQARLAAHALLGVSTATSISPSGATRPTSTSGTLGDFSSAFASASYVVMNGAQHPGNESGVSTVNGNTTATQLPSLGPPSLTNQDEN